MGAESFSSFSTRPHPRPAWGDDAPSLPPLTSSTTRRDTGDTTTRGEFLPWGDKALVFFADEELPSIKQAAKADFFPTLNDYQISNSRRRRNPGKYDNLFRSARYVTRYLTTVIDVGHAILRREDHMGQQIGIRVRHTSPPTGLWILTDLDPRTRCARPGRLYVVRRRGLSRL